MSQFHVCKEANPARHDPAGSDLAIWRLWPPPSPWALPRRRIRLPIPTLVVPELAAVGWPRRTSRRTHAKQPTPASTGDAVANCKVGASDELCVPHPPRRAERLALTTWTRLGRCNSTRQACFQPGAWLRRRGSSARSCARARARRLGRRRVLWEVRARRRPTARVVWAIPPTSCVPHRAAATCGAGLRLARGDGVPRARRRVDTASAEATGLALAVHRPGSRVNARAPRVQDL